MITVTAVGRLGRDAELRQVGQQSVCSFPIAVDTGKKDDQGKNIAEWYSCDLWGKRGETLQQYLTKGGQVAVAGRFELQKYTKDGVLHTKGVISVNDLKLLGGGSRDGEAKPAPAPKPAPKPQPVQHDIDAIFMSDEEIPF